MQEVRHKLYFVSLPKIVNQFDRYLMLKYGEIPDMIDNNDQMQFGALFSSYDFEQDIVDFHKKVWELHAYIGLDKRVAVRYMKAYKIAYIQLKFEITPEGAKFNEPN